MVFKQIKTLKNLFSKFEQYKGLDFVMNSKNTKENNQK